MSRWSGEVDAFLQALAKSGCDGAEAQMPRLLAAMEAPPEEDQLRRALDALRAQRCFSLMKVLAERALELAPGNALVYVRRQLAQALIDLGLLDPAIEGLKKLEKEGALAGRQKSEVVGLLGRALKQRFVLAVGHGGKGDDDLRASIARYGEVFALDPAWHGANLVALVRRAERDGIQVATPSAETWARRLLQELQEKGEVAWSPWDHAAAGEACLALGDRDGAARAFFRYWSAPGVDRFALAGTERQLREIWQFREDSPDRFEAALVLQLLVRGRALLGDRFTAADLAALADGLKAQAGQAEAVFGAGSAIPLGQMLGLLQWARSVCRVADPYHPQRGGTGFLVSGKDLSPDLDGVLVLTNHHVLHGPEASDQLLETKDYQGSVDVGRAEAEFHLWDRKDGGPERRTVKLKEVAAHSIRAEADFALATLAEPLPGDRALPLSRKEKPLGSRNVLDAKQRSKVFVVGHPLGGVLSFSLSDNEVVDHELDDAPSRPHHPRRIHYRAPTQPGSSGSPVFHHETLEVVGLHRTGDATPLRDDWPRGANETKYQANEAVAIRSIREALAQQVIRDRPDRVRP